MFNQNSIFPSYGNLSEIRVSLPQPPSRSKIARGVEDLWNIHTSEPHIVINEDPGVIVPLPDEGYDMRGLSETSNVNELVNRAGASLSEKEIIDLSSKLLDIYQSKFEINQSLLSERTSEIKQEMLNSNPGSLLIYNGTDKESLIKALSIVQGLEQLSSQELKSAVFPLETKQMLVSFVNLSQPTRFAMLEPNDSIRQKILNGTSVIDELQLVLQAFGLSERENPKVQISNEQLSDHMNAIELAELELKLRKAQEIAQGVCYQSMLHVLRQVDQSFSPDIYKIVTKPVADCLKLACQQTRQYAKKVQSKLLEICSELQKLGVDTRTIKNISETQKNLELLIRMKDSPIPQAVQKQHRVMHPMSSVIQWCDQAVSHIQARVPQSSTMEQVKLLCEIYTILCIRDCAISYKSRMDSHQKLSQNLLKAMSETLDDSRMFIKEQRNLDSQKKELHVAQHNLNLESLNKAKDENLISVKKLETLKSLIS